MAASIHPVKLRCEYLTNPLGIDVNQPRLSWLLEGKRRGARQTGYRIVVTLGPHDLGKEQGNVWDSGRVESSQSIHVPYGGPLLRSRTRYHWKVQVCDEDGQVAESEPAFWEMGLLDPGEWQASWIGLGNAGPFGAPLPPEGLNPVQGGEPASEEYRVFGEHRPSPYLRKTFEVTKPVGQARLYATARGLYGLHLNGRRVGNAQLTPGWTGYDKRIQYQTYDVSAYLKPGSNALGAILGDGWYCGYLGFDPRWRAYHYGLRPSLLLQLVIEFTDGSTLTVVSDDSWKSNIGPILFSDLQMGEVYDARLELTDWDLPGYDDGSWCEVDLLEGTSAALVAQVSPLIRITEELAPISLSEPSPGVFVFDMGQNMVGWARLRIQGHAGTAARLRFAEMLGDDGTLYTDNLRGARQTDSFILSGDGKDIFEPHFTFHGFRYVELTGYPGRPTLESLTGCVLHNDLEPAGEFESSSSLLNQLQRNITWSQRGNYLSVPTDCPQRDERLGWLGDAQVFLRTATFNMDVAPFFTKWMRDVTDAQSETGAFSDVAPRAGLPSDGAPGWGDAGVIIPWMMYQVYDDTRIIEEHYAAMTRWMAYLQEANPRHLRVNCLNLNFGDWLSVEANTPKEVLATAYYAYDARLMSEVARALGRDEDARAFARLFEDIKAAFVDAYVSADGRVTGNTQTCYLLALHMDLLPEGLRPKAAARLARDIEARSGHLSTGFIGVGYLCPVLSEAGYTDAAYRLALNDTFPSWGYSIRHGATTIWERWDGWTDEHGFQLPAMNSFNHYSFGAVGEWLYRYVGGINLDPEQPGYKHILLRPQPGGGLRYAKVRYRSIRGEISSHWSLEGTRLDFSATIPANTTATLYLPTTKAQAVTEGGQSALEAPGVTLVANQPDRAVFELASGSYSFVSDLTGHPLSARGAA